MFPLLLSLSLSMAVSSECLTYADQEPSLAASLDQVLAGQRRLQNVRLEVKLIDGGRESSITVYGDGLGIHWQGKQFRASAKMQLRLLRTLQLAKFLSMPEHLGKLPKGVERSDSPSRICLHIGNRSKVVEQEGRGVDADGFVRLAKELLAPCIKESASGLGVSNLGDGLTKVLEHRIDVRAMKTEVRYLRHMSRYRLQIEGRAATIEGNLTNNLLLPGFEGLKSLTAQQLTSFIKTLQAQKFSELPWGVRPGPDISLWITVRVLDKEHSVGGWNTRIFEKSVDKNWDRLDGVWKASKLLEPTRR